MPRLSVLVLYHAVTGEISAKIDFCWVNIDLCEWNMNEISYENE